MNEKELKLNAPFEKPTGLFAYRLKRSLIPFLMGLGAFIVLYTSIVEIFNRAIIEWIMRNYFRPLIAASLGAIVVFAVGAYGMRHGEFKVLGLSRKTELFVDYVCALITSIVYTLVTIGVAYLYQKIFSIGTELYTVDFEYNAKAFFTEFGLGLIICMAIFASFRMIIDVAYDKGIFFAVGASLLWIAATIALYAVFAFQIKNGDVRDILAFTDYKHVLPYGLSLFAAFTALDVARMRRDYIR